MSRMDLGRIYCKCVEAEGGCLLWIGKVNARNGHPSGTEWVDGKDRYVGVRRRAYEEYNRVTLAREDVITCTCGDPACLAKDHLERITIAERSRRMHAAMTAVAKIQRGKKLSAASAQRRGLTEEQARAILESDDGPYVTAARMGVSGVVASRVRRGVTYKTYEATPWSGL
jgi:hypothetical protein